MTRIITIKANKTYRVKPEEVYESKVIPSGGGAVILSRKVDVGKKVLVIVIDEMTT